MGGARVIDAVGASREDEPLVAPGLYLPDGYFIEVFYFGIDVVFPDPPGDQLVILAAEIEN